jgi:hypothetical protein
MAAASSGHWFCLCKPDKVRYCHCANSHLSNLLAMLLLLEMVLLHSYDASLSEEVCP